ncbi:MAG TPA: gamma-glutamylcyclotransferase family protein [Solirubrobacteraceae bacterium]|nr:gamma-glutamylcyclotransferase family protein [Solirubrobacteraceae bacterium]
MTGSHERCPTLARVLAYPYLAPDGPFSLAGGCADEEPELVAFGANADPGVLAGKLGADTPVSARRAALADHDIAFSAHVAPYGAIPAALVPSPGTSVAVHLLRLTARDRARLDATEPNYVREELAPGLEAYRSRHGVLTLDGGPVALAAVRARGRVFPALTQEALLERLRVLLAPSASLQAFVLAQAHDAQVRATRTAWLRRRARR